MTIICKSHEFFSASLEALTPAGVAEIWGIKPRQAYKYGHDPQFCSSASKDPLQRLREQLERLKSIQRLDVIDGGLKYLTEPVGYSVEVTHVATDRNSVHRELIDVSKELGELSRCVQQILEENGVSPDYKRKIVRQVNETIQQLLQLRDAAEKGLV
jgi:hypothetical protein